MSLARVARTEARQIILDSFPSLLSIFLNKLQEQVGGSRKTCHLSHMCMEREVRFSSG